MQLTLNKSELVGALPALGKLVSRTSLVKMFQAIQIEGRANTLYFRTRNVVEEIEFRMTADLEDDVPAVWQRSLRQAVESLASHDDGMSGGKCLETLQVGRKPIKQLAVQSDGIVLCYRRDDANACHYNFFISFRNSLILSRYV